MPSTHLALTNDDVLQVAKLACLFLNTAEIEKFRTQLDQTVSYVENLNELDTTNVKATSHSTQVVNVFFIDGMENQRLLSQNQALQNAKDTKDGKFVVPRIM